MTDRISVRLLLWACCHTGILLMGIPFAGCSSSDAEYSAAAVSQTQGDQPADEPRTFVPAADAKPITSVAGNAEHREQQVQHLESAGRLPVSNPFFQAGMNAPPTSAPQASAPSEPQYHLPNFDVAMSPTVSRKPSTNVTSPAFDPGHDFELNTPQQSFRQPVPAVRSLPGSNATAQVSPKQVGRIRALPQREPQREIIRPELESPMQNNLPFDLPLPTVPTADSIADARTSINQPTANQPTLAPVKASAGNATNNESNDNIRPLPISSQDVRQDLLKRLAEMEDRRSPLRETNPEADLLDDFVPARSPLPAAVSKRAYDLVIRGNGLAQRSAFFSAQEDFMEALRVVARGNDAMTENEREQHLTAINQAFLAMKEAEDFVADTTFSGQRLFRLIETHQTPALKGVAASELSTPLALDAYHRFAHKRLIQAAGREPMAAEAMVRLGKLRSEQAKGSGRNSLSTAKAILFYDAALAIQPGHPVASNELGVAMAKLGKMEEARRILAGASHYRSQEPNRELSYNLAVVNRALGYPSNDRQLAQGPPPAYAVDFVPPAQFGPQPSSLQDRPQQPQQAIAGNRPVSASPEQPWWQVWRRNPDAESRR